jgi:hypothetical protein
MMEQALEEIVEALNGESHMLSCGDLDNPFNNKVEIDGCNCGTFRRPGVYQARMALKQYRAAIGRKEKAHG